MGGLSGFWDFVGTSYNYFRVGLNGFRLKNSSGVAEIKNAADSAYAAASADTVNLVDPANPTRSVHLKAPTLAAGYDLKMPTGIGSSGQYVKSNGSDGLTVGNNGAGIYRTADGTGLYKQVDSSGDPQFGTAVFKNTRRIDLNSTTKNPPNVGGINSTVKVHDYGDAVETLFDSVLQIWRDVTPGIVSLDFSAVGVQYPFNPQDLFMYWDGATNSAKVHVKEWANSGVIAKSITNVTNATPPVLTVGSGHGFVTDNLVVPIQIGGAAASLNEKLYRIIAKTSTTVTLGTLEGTNVAAGGAYTSGGLLQLVTPGTASHGLTLTSNNGVDVADLNSELGAGHTVWGKYLGSVCYGEQVGKIYDTLDRPFIWNNFNRVARPVSTYSADTTAVSWTPSSTSTTPTNSRASGGSYGFARLWVLCGIDNADEQDLEYVIFPQAPLVISEVTVYSNYASLNAITNYDSTTPDSFSYAATKAHIGGSVANSGDNYIDALITKAQITQKLGLKFWQAMEFIYNSGANTWTIYKNFVGGTSNQFVYKGGWRGYIKR